MSEFIHSCDMLHPFRDANIRTFGMLICNRLLIENGFNIVILDDPNRFDGHSVTQLSLEIMNGMKRASEIFKTPFKWDSELKSFEKATQAENKLYDIEKKIRTTEWELFRGEKIFLDEKNSKQVPKNVAKQWAMIELVKEGKLQPEEALKHIQDIGSKAAECISFFDHKQRKLITTLLFQ